MYQPVVNYVCDRCHYSVKRQNGRGGECDHRETEEPPLPKGKVTVSEESWDWDLILNNPKKVNPNVSTSEITKPNTVHRADGCKRAQNC